MPIQIIKELAEILDVPDETIINWEIRGMRPVGINMKKLRSYFPELK